MLQYIRAGHWLGWISWTDAEASETAGTKYLFLKVLVPLRGEGSASVLKAVLKFIPVNAHARIIQISMGNCAFYG